MRRVGKQRPSFGLCSRHENLFGRVIEKVVYLSNFCIFATQKHYNMREHTFRAQRKDNKQWVYGSLVEQYNGSFIIPKTEKEELPNFIDVIPETVGMQTTIKDQHDKEIYEGDVIAVLYWYDPIFHDFVKTDTTIPCEVCFHDGSFTFKLGDIYARLEAHLKNDIEVIGNKHDNPELLKR